MQFEEFLKRAAPLVGVQPRPFQRRGIKRKIEKRRHETGARSLEEFFRRIEEDPEEQEVLSRILTVTISRFFRDREVFDCLSRHMIPSLIARKNKPVIHAWSIGCANGEEPYSVLLLWEEDVERSQAAMHLSVVGSDIRQDLLDRAKRGIYKKSSVGEVPVHILQKFFTADAQRYILDEKVREKVAWRKHDILRDPPIPGMDIVFCRNVCFTYFSRKSQVDVLTKIASSLNPGGYLVVGKDESIPLHHPALFAPAFEKEKIYRKLAS
jgi:chemotaxis protein methyltransferase CheR